MKSVVASAIPKGSKITPLVIILSFVLLTEVVVMTGVLATKDTVQLLLTIFCVFFPSAIAVPFFLILAKTPWVLYAPGDFGTKVDPTSYINAMRAQTYIRATATTKKLIADLPDIIDRALTNAEDVAHEKKGNENNFPNADRGIQLQSNISTIISEIEKNELISVDLSDFDGSVTKFPVSRSTPISDVLDAIYFDIYRTYPIEAHTYGQSWMLVDVNSGRKYPEMGSMWSKDRGLESDERPIENVGISPGMNLKAVKLKGRGRAATT
ncbi:hypothetical protein [Rhizobium leguminosarum]